MNITFQPIGGATFILRIDDLKIAIDPVLCSKGTVQDYFWFRSKRLEDPIYEKTDFENVDLWLITHDHEDHLDEKGLAVMSTQSKVISNGNASKILQKKLFDDLTVLQWGDTSAFKLKGLEITVEAIPAIHGVSPVSAFLAGKVNGYYITVSNGKETRYIYITSDTVLKKKVIDTMKDRPIDILIPNMGAAKQGSWIMTLTLNARMLKIFIAELNPKMVLPVHFGTFQHYNEPIEKTRELDDDRIRVVKTGARWLITGL